MSHRSELRDSAAQRRGGPPSSPRVDAQDDHATSTAPHDAAPECGSATNLTVQAVGAIIGFVLTTLFVADPTPALMALFFFVAQPLFVIVGLMYLARVLRELREKDVL